MLSPAYVLRDNTSRPKTHIGLNIRLTLFKELKNVLHNILLNYRFYTLYKSKTYYIHTNVVTYVT